MPEYNLHPIADNLKDNLDFFFEKKLTTEKFNQFFWYDRVEGVARTTSILIINLNKIYFYFENEMEMFRILLGNSTNMNFVYMTNSSFLYKIEIIEAKKYESRF